MDSAASPWSCSAAAAAAVPLLLRLWTRRGFKGGAPWGACADEGGPVEHEEGG